MASRGLFGFGHFGGSVCILMNVVWFVMEELMREKKEKDDTKS